MRVVTAIKFAMETGIQSYKATALTMAMTKPPVEAAVKIWSVPSQSEILMLVGLTALQ